MKPFSSPAAQSFLRLVLLAIGGLVLAYFWFGTAGPQRKEIPYTELLTDVNEGRVERAEIRATEIVATLKKVEDPKKKEQAPETVRAARLPNIDERELIDGLKSHGVTVVGVPEQPSHWAILLGLLPFLIFPLLLFGLSRLASASGPTGKPLTFGKSKAKVYDRSKDNPVTFADVAGVDEAKAELAEIVSFLREPDRYRAVGARVPKGVLLVGAPGTGKTLLAKAVAGEAGVPFFSMSGSEFVEMFVGVGASRARDLFEQAKERAPCIIFIDELDAIGKARAGAAGFAANEEREQTLNQLLVEMDGFDPAVGLIIMAATNRPEILDRALLRAGRFDRQVLVDRPDLRGRQDILAVHVRKVSLGVDVDLAVIAQRTPGMVGADLANVVNEAALASVRRKSEHVDAEDFEEAIDRLQLGLKKEGRVLTEDDKQRVALHEAGHALVALSLTHVDPVHRVTIIPRSVGALGATLQLPARDKYLMTRDELRDRVCVLLGGRSAEEIATDAISTGAEDDLERATELAKQMVCRFGMSEALGPVTFRSNGGAVHPWTGFPEGDALSEETRRLIDREVKNVLVREHDRARRVLTDRRDTLWAIARELIARETLQRADLEALVGRESGPVLLDRPSGPARAATHEGA